MIPLCIDDRLTGPSIMLACVIIPSSVCAPIIVVMLLYIYSGGKTEA